MYLGTNITEVTKSLWAKNVACKGDLVNVYRVLVRKETHGRPSGRWETLLIFTLTLEAPVVLHYLKVPTAVKLTGVCFIAF